MSDDDLLGPRMPGRPSPWAVAAFVAACAFASGALLLLILSLH